MASMQAEAAPYNGLERHFLLFRLQRSACVKTSARNASLLKNGIGQPVAPANGGRGRPIVEFSTLVKVLRWRALEQPEQRIYSHLVDGEKEGTHLTYAALDWQARAIGAMLQTHCAGGARVLLLYPTGLEFIAAFFGCLYAGVIAVPVPPPNPAQPQRTLPRLRAITNDARPSVALTTSSILSKMNGLFTQTPDLQTMRWLATDTLANTLAPEWQEPAVTSNTRVLLQYTSGSTTAPKGVMVSHGNLLHNSANISQAFEITADTVSVTWLPVFHDMG
jgi:acyl-CoA synthetase (AMP-forming)/AMP-acid ligase II